MTTDTPELEEVRVAWDNRNDDPIATANRLADRFQSEKTTPYSLALEVGARPAEVSVYLDLAELDATAREILVSEDLPLSLASDLVKEGEKQQNELLELVLDARDRTDDIPALFEKIANDYYEERGVNASTLSGAAMMHLASKAKSYNALSNRRRQAIFSIGRTKQRDGYSGLSKKQIHYVNDILQELQDDDILGAACPDEETCEHCQRIESLLKEMD